ncbi:MAG: hypothetical protein M1814_003608 [Vezdaea aestivalis]|nr:MAG: hypothetical protein M1814_003608 [Vezdaea aestivalis]
MQPHHLFLLLASPLIFHVEGQFGQLARVPNNRPLRPYVYPVVVGGVRYFREYTRQQWLQRRPGAFTGRDRITRLTSTRTRSSQSGQDGYPSVEKAMDDIFGKRAHIYDDSYHVEVAADFVQWAAPGLGQNILDLACGTGVVGACMKAFVGSEGRVVGVDISMRMIDYARIKAKAMQIDLEFFQHDVTNLDGLNLPKTFSTIVCSSAFLFLGNRIKTLQHWATYLEPGGKIIIDMPSQSRRMISNAIGDAAARIGVPVLSDTSWVYGPEAVESMMAAAGLEGEAFSSRTYRSRPITLPEGLFMLDQILRGPFGRGFVRSTAELTQLMWLAETNYRETFMSEMDDNGLVLDEIAFLVGIGTKPSD